MNLMNLDESNARDSSFVLSISRTLTVRSIPEPYLERVLVVGLLLYVCIYVCMYILLCFSISTLFTTSILVKVADN
jgi:hypothetical protein